jgi:hypothetical protein
MVGARSPRTSADHDAVRACNVKGVKIGAAAFPGCPFGVCGLGEARRTARRQLRIVPRRLSVGDLLERVIRLKVNGADLPEVLRRFEPLQASARRAGS